jgi:hypothetical protein
LRERVSDGGVQIDIGVEKDPGAKGKALKARKPAKVMKVAKKETTKRLVAKMDGIVSETARPATRRSTRGSIGAEAVETKPEHEAPKSEGEQPPVLLPSAPTYSATKRDDGACKRLSSNHKHRRIRLTRRTNGMLGRRHLSRSKMLLGWLRTTRLQVNRTRALLTTQRRSLDLLMRRKLTRSAALSKMTFLLSKTPLRT